ncbi:MAG TPA: hypothetical protein VMW76_08000 [Bacteroidales bacterium]|nr:hypothetical protein [Bacteroidales bacterium]
MNCNLRFTGWKTPMQPLGFISGKNQETRENTWQAITVLQMNTHLGSGNNINSPS